ncbi:hypothetical protein MAH1_18790 [Sessilibacter sp. MAH1]
MKDIDDYIYELAVIIDENSECTGSSCTFKVDVVEEEWNKLDNGVEFKKVLTKLMSRNQIAIVAKNTGEVRDLERTD